MKYLHGDLTSAVLDAFYYTYYELGYGFAEKVYENSLSLVLGQRGISFRRQCSIDVYFLNQQVGHFVADMIVEEKVILELKAADCICASHEAQLLNYLRATSIEVGLLLNFGEKPEARRKLFTNERKKFPTNIP